MGFKILGIESSCDETAASVVEDGRKIFSNVVATQIEEHQKFGGVVPEIASRKHAEDISRVVEKAMSGVDNIDAVAVTYAPGLIGSLLVGVNFAKGFSFSLDLPLIPVHHLRAHVASNYITNLNLKPPFLCLIVSGGHSHIVDVSDYTSYKIIGRTRDDAAGEVFDKVARCIGLVYPGGVHLDEIAENGDDRVFQFPSPKVKDSPYDYSFSGLKTCAVNIIHNANQKGQLINKQDLAASFRKAVVENLIEKFLCAAKVLKRKKIVIAGGVSANRLLRRRLREEADLQNLELFMPDVSLSGDNAAMVASQAYYEYLNGNIAKDDLNALATLSIV